jgi:molybdate transport system substrate-binding protein
MQYKTVTTLLGNLVSACLLILACTQTQATEIKVAVAGNFTDTIKAISKKFESNTGHKVSLSFGSTGKHYAQIKNGAPFHAFLAADIKRPELLEKEGLIIPGSRFAYALGRIVLWSPNPELIDSDGKILEQGDFHYLAIANPKLAPYGHAAREIMQAREVWNRLRGHIVRGENIGQAFQFIKSGNAELGFVAYSQVKHPDHTFSGSIWEVPQKLYSPIEQQAVLLKDDAAAHAFLDFMRSKPALDIIQAYGYGIPNVQP